jgi:hypothetical protein
MFKMDPQYIVAGEIIRTARMYASSVSPLSLQILERLGGGLLKRLGLGSSKNSGGKRKPDEPRVSNTARDFTNNIKISGEIFELESVKGKKRVILTWDKLSRIKDEAARLASAPAGDVLFKGLKGCIILDGKYRLLEGEKLKLILRLSASLEIDGAVKRSWPRKKEFSSTRDMPALLEVLPLILVPALCKTGKKDLGFICLTSSGAGTYRVTCSRGFHSALNESLASLESLIDDISENVDIEEKNIVNQTFRRLSGYLDR